MKVNYSYLQCVLRSWLCSFLPGAAAFLGHRVIILSRVSLRISPSSYQVWTRHTPTRHTPPPFGAVLRLIIPRAGCSSSLTGLQAKGKDAGLSHIPSSPHQSATVTMNSFCQERVAAAMAAALAAKGSENSVEMRLYLNKLKDLVPQCPKNRKVTKLELIQHVIDYISDLQDTLQSDTDSESPPDSPVEHMSFSDAYSMPPPNSYPEYMSQDSRSVMTPAGFSLGFGGSQHESSHRYGGSSLSYGSDYSASAYSTGPSAAAGYSAGCSSFSGAFSPILYSDQGTAPPPRFASS